MHLEIIFEDRHCLVVNKPARLLTASDKSGDQTLLALVRDYNAEQQAEGKKGYLVPIHFLDRPVSGVVLFAKSSKAAARLNEQFKKRTLEKIYDAIVEGVVSEPSAVLSDYLAKDREQNVVRTVRKDTPESKHAELSYQMVSKHGALSWLKVAPKTGRSHQIRVQLSSRGMPLYGDMKYGASAAWDGRIALHARSLTFKHPVGGHDVKVVAPVPEYWSKIWPGSNNVQ